MVTSQILSIIDLHDKKRAYRRNGVQEYLVWRTLEGQLDWFVLAADEYVAQQPDDQGILRSQIFPGLWLAVSALLAGETAIVLSVLQQGLASPEHQAFVASNHRVGAGRMPTPQLFFVRVVSPKENLLSLSLTPNA